MAETIDKPETFRAKRRGGSTLEPVTESVRQSYVVMKNEIRKFFSGKRMLVFLALMGAILAILTLGPYLVGGSLSDNVGTVTSSYLTMSSFVVLMGATLFASICIVSEYEERTALIIFTRPIRKISIFTGKALASLAVTIGFVALYYLITALVSLIAAGGVDPDLPVSFGMACMYAFAATGVAMLVSCVLKKASTATIITFVLLLAVMPAFSMVLSMAGADASWMMDQAGAAITNCSDSYRDMTNEAIEGLAQSLSDPTQYFDVNLLMESLKAWEFSGTINDLGAILTGSFNLTEIGSVISSMQVSAPDIPFDVGVLAVWGLVSMAAGFFLFLRREF